MSRLSGRLKRAKVPPQLRQRPGRAASRRARETPVVRGDAPRQGCAWHEQPERPRRQRSKHRHDVDEARGSRRCSGDHIQKQVSRVVVVDGRSPLVREYRTVTSSSARNVSEGRAARGHAMVGVNGPGCRTRSPAECDPEGRTAVEHHQACHARGNGVGLRFDDVRLAKGGYSVCCDVIQPRRVVRAGLRSAVTVCGRRARKSP